MYDIIVIGGGHNGLTTATLLAKKGKKVLLVEKRPILGGIAAGEEFHPDYRTNGLLHDTSGVRKKVVESLQLEKYGLKLAGRRPSVVLLSKEGEGLHLTGTLEKDVEEISKFSKKDSEAYIRYRQFIEKISPFIYPLLNEVPPDLVKLGVGELLALGKKAISLRKLGKKTMLELMKVAPMSVADFLNEYFETDFLKAGLAGPAIYGSYTGPWSSYTTLNLLLSECCARDQVIGGPHALIRALEAAATDAGVEIRTGIAAQKILLDSAGKVKGVLFENREEETAPAVAASCTPHETFMNLLQPNEISYEVEQGITHYRSRGTTAKVNLALNEPLQFKFNSSDEIELARTGNTFDEMEKAFDSVKYRRMSDEPILDIHIPTSSNPDLAPEGHSVVSILVHYVPHHFDAGWTVGEKKKLGDRVVKTLEGYTKGLKASIISQEVLSPVDLEERYGLTNGHIFHGEHAVDQLITRPVPSCARYGTPISGLYLCGSGTHPGGGITCAPGALAAEVILM